MKAGLLIGGLGLFLLAVGAGAVGDAAVLLPFGLESVFGVEALAGISESSHLPWRRRGLLRWSVVLALPCPYCKNLVASLVDGV